MMVYVVLTAPSMYEHETVEEVFLSRRGAEQWATDFWQNLKTYDQPTWESSGRVRIEEHEAE